MFGSKIQQHGIQARKSIVWTITFFPPIVDFYIGVKAIESIVVSLLLPTRLQALHVWFPACSH